MGLDEKRKLKEIQDGPLKAAQSKIKDILGVEIPIELDVATFTTLNELNTFQHTGLNQAVEMVKSIAKDDMGKEALKESLKKIVFRNLPVDVSSKNKATFDNGVLTNESTWGGGSYAHSGDMSRVVSAKL